MRWLPSNPLAAIVDWWRDRRRRRRRPQRLELPTHYSDVDNEWIDARIHEFSRRNNLCRHDDPLCRKYGCPDDPSWKGDGCAP